jgi:copper(I)-binding protein
MRTSTWRRSVTPSITRPLVLLLVAVALGACSSTVGGGVSVADAWVRPPMGSDLPAAGYLTITGGDAADALVAASSPAAMTVEIHETSPGMSGMTAMHPVDRIEVAEGATVKLEPGGYHLMLMGPDTETIVVGATVEITLTFEEAGEVVVEAEVRAG